MRVGSYYRIMKDVSIPWVPPIIGEKEGEKLVKKREQGNQ